MEYFWIKLEAKKKKKYGRIWKGLICSMIHFAPNTQVKALAQNIILASKDIQNMELMRKPSQETTELLA